jgi:hypothetical protein
MKPQLDMNNIARGLRAEREGKVSAGGGYFGAMQLLADIETRFRVPAGGGRIPIGPNDGLSHWHGEPSSVWKRSRRMLEPGAA